MYNVVSDYLRRPRRELFMARADVAESRAGFQTNALAVWDDHCAQVMDLEGEAFALALKRKL